MDTKKQLFDPLFLITLILLLLNDFIWKYQFHNYFTGKLSDFVGLFAFSFFVGIYVRRYRLAAFVIIALSFVFWKSSYSEGSLLYLQNLGIPIGRIVDYSDLMALVVLPLSYYRLQQEPKAIHPQWIPQTALIALSLFAFVATSLPIYRQALEYDSDLVIDYPAVRDSLFKKFNYVEPLADSASYRVYLSYDGFRSEIGYRIKFIESWEDAERFELDSIVSLRVQGNKKDIEKLLEELDQAAFERIFVELVEGESPE